MREVTIGALAAAGAVCFGDGYRTKRSEHGQPGYRILRVADIDDGAVRLEGSDFVRQEYAPAIGAKVSQGGDILLTTKGTVGRVAIYPEGLEQAVYSPQLCFFRVTDATVLHPRFLAYWFKSPDFARQALRRANNTDMAPYINLRDIASLAIDLPNIDYQIAVDRILSSLDNKLSVNERIASRLRELAAAKFHEAVEESSDLISLDRLATFHNRSRVPLSSRDRERRKGSVPYYGAAGLLDHVDAALFDQALVLVGEDGSVIRCDGTPVIQYIWGPAWVNNHAHVLTGSRISTEALRIMLMRANVAHLVTGAVQPKISMGNLKRLQLQVPTHIARLESELAAFAASERAVLTESSVLKKAREELLPLLVSGKVRIRDAEKVVEGVS